MKNHVELDSNAFFKACSTATDNFRKKLEETAKEHNEDFSGVKWLSEYLTCQVFALELNDVLFNDDDEFDNVTFEEAVNDAGDEIVTELDYKDTFNTND